MRPKLLKMTAFGPYAGEQSIDFEKLEDANMFLIYGPTGGGKTTILDAICYALYGQTNGGERSGENMRSKFAEPGTITEVELFFRLRQDEYRIIRRPQYERAPKKGSGKMVKVMSEVELYKKEGDTYKIITAKLNDADKKINELLHFNISQFRQVIMIAQNKFRELLTVSSKERQQILQDIFETGIYENVEKVLDSMSSKAKEGIREKELSYGNILSNIEEIDDPLLTDYLNTKVIYNAPDVCERLEAICANKETECKEVTKSLKEIKESLDVAHKNLVEMTTQYEAVKERKEIAIKLQALNEKEASYSELEKKVVLAEKAVAILPIEEIVEELKVQVIQAQNQLEEHKLKLSQTEEQLLGQTDKLKEQEDMPKIVEGLKKTYSILETYVPKVKILSEKEREKVEQEGLLIKAREKYDKLIVEAERLKVEIEEQKVNLKSRDTIQQEYANMQIKQKEILSILEVKAQKLTKEKEAKLHYEVLQRLNAEITELTQTHLVYEEEYKIAFTSWFNNQAGEIAKALEEDKPCPVCGSLHHPKKASINGEQITKQDLESLETKVKEALGKLNAQREKRTGEEKECKLLKNYIDELDTKLQGHELVTEEVSQELAKSLSAYEAQLKSLNNLQEQLEQNQKSYAVLEEKKEKGATFIAESQAKLSEIVAYINSIIQDVPRELCDPIVLEKRLIEMQKDLQSKEDGYNVLMMQVERLNNEKMQKLAVIEEVQKQIESVKLQGSQKKIVLSEALAKAGFSSYHHYKESKMSQSEITEHKELIVSYNNEKIRLSAKDKELEEKTKGFNETQLKEKQEVYDELLAATTALSLKQNDLNKYIVVHHKIIAELKQLFETVTDMLKKQQVIDKISSLAKGKNKKGLSFERYIQSSIFEEVLASANKKLKPMTQNRYELYRTDELSRANAQAGLDIGIIDYYNNETRSVNTLSGGESFMAALALALGLSEVIQRLAGATPLDTLFIDEGFGSLDEEALDMAIKTLLSIQDTGRLIGIISHVRELREQIPVSLEIATGPKGSKATFKL